MSALSKQKREKGGSASAHALGTGHSLLATAAKPRYPRGKMRKEVKVWVKALGKGHSLLAAVPSALAPHAALQICLPFLLAFPAQGALGQAAGAR